MTKSISSAKNLRCHGRAGECKQPLNFRLQMFTVFVEVMHLHHLGFTYMEIFESMQESGKIKFRNIGQFYYHRNEVEKIYLKNQGGIEPPINFYIERKRTITVLSDETGVHFISHRGKDNLEHQLIIGPKAVERSKQVFAEWVEAKDS